MINVDETRWPIMGSTTPTKGTVWGVRSPTVSFYRILPGKSADEGRQVLNGYAGTVVADGFAVYDVLARDGPSFTAGVDPQGYPLRALYTAIAQPGAVTYPEELLMSTPTT